MLAHPVAVGLRRGDLLLQLVVADDAALFQIDEQHAARLETALTLDALRRNVQHADFGRHDDQAVLGDVVARRPQTVAVQRGTNANAVGEGHRRRTVPRLHQRRVEFVERFLFRRHGGIAAPRLGDHHHHGMRQRPAGQHQQLQHVVEHRRIAAGLVDNRQQLFHVVPEQAGGEQTFAGRHPVDVAAQRVDLAVVGQVAIRVARIQLGKVFVLKREWTRARADSIASSLRSG